MIKTSRGCGCSLRCDEERERDCVWSLFFFYSLSISLRVCVCQCVLPTVFKSFASGGADISVVSPFGLFCVLFFCCYN